MTSSTSRTATPGTSSCPAVSRPRGPRAVSVSSTRSVCPWQARDRQHRRREGAQDALESKPVVIAERAGQNGRLFGAVSSKEIAEGVKAIFDKDIDRRTVEFVTPIKCARRAQGDRPSPRRDLREPLRPGHRRQGRDFQGLIRQPDRAPRSLHCDLRHHSCDREGAAVAVVVAVLPSRGCRPCRPGGSAGMDETRGMFGISQQKKQILTLQAQVRDLEGLVDELGARAGVGDVSSSPSCAPRSGPESPPGPPTGRRGPGRRRDQRLPVHTGAGLKEAKDAIDAYRVR